MPSSRSLCPVHVHFAQFTLTLPSSHSLAQFTFTCPAHIHFAQFTFTSPSSHSLCPVHIHLLPSHIQFYILCTHSTQSSHSLSSSHSIWPKFTFNLAQFGFTLLSSHWLCPAQVHIQFDVVHAKFTPVHISFLLNSHSLIAQTHSIFHCSHSIRPKFTFTLVLFAFDFALFTFVQPSLDSVAQFPV